MITNRVPPQFGIITSCAYYAESQTCALKVVTSDSHCENTQQNLGLPVAHMGLWWFGMNFQSFLCPACHRLKFKCGGKLEVLEAHPHSLLSANTIFFSYIYLYIFTSSSSSSSAATKLSFHHWMHSLQYKWAQPSMFVIRKMDAHLHHSLLEI